MGESGTASKAKAQVHNANASLTVEFNELASNGLKCNLVSSSDIDSNKFSMRVLVPLMHGNDGTKPPIGRLLAQTILEGGATTYWTQEHIEAFCDHYNIKVDVHSDEGFIVLDFDTTVDDNTHSHPSGVGQDIDVLDPLTNTEALFQLVQLVLTDLKWEHAAFDRAQGALCVHNTAAAGGKDGVGLLASCRQMARDILIHNSTSHAYDVATAAVCNCTFNMLKAYGEQLMSDLSRMECTVVSSRSVGWMKEVVMKGLGNAVSHPHVHIPVHALQHQHRTSANSSDNPFTSVDAPQQFKHSQLSPQLSRTMVYGQDEQFRAVGVLVGLSPNPADGVLPCGSSMYRTIAPRTLTLTDEEQAMYCKLVMLVFQEVS